MNMRIREENCVFEEGKFVCMIFFFDAYEKEIVYFK